MAYYNIYRASTLGPGNPELVTVKATRVIGAVDVVAYHNAQHGSSITRAIAEPYLQPGHIEYHSMWPMTTEKLPTIPAALFGGLEDSAKDTTRRIAAYLETGRSVTLLTEGNPLFYSSYMHLHAQLTHRYDAVVVPELTSVSAGLAAIATPLVTGDEVLTVLPGTLPMTELSHRLI